MTPAFRTAKMHEAAMPITGSPRECSRAVLTMLASAVFLLTWPNLGGCATDPREGYSTQPLHAETFRTIAVPIFQNSTFDRDVEFALTEAVIKEIEARTPYRVTTQTRANSILHGTIRRVERRQMSRSRTTGLGEEVGYFVTIDFEWRDLLTDVPLVTRTSFVGQGLFLPSAPIGETEESGRFGAIAVLARDIVNEMQSAW